MKSRSIAVLLVAMMIIGAVADPRTLLEAGSEDVELSVATEHQRILAELEEVHQLRERMLQEGMGVPSCKEPKLRKERKKILCCQPTLYRAA